MSNATSDPVLPDGLAQAIDDIVEQTGMYEDRQEFVREACREHLFYVLSRQADRGSGENPVTMDFDDSTSNFAATMLTSWEENEERPPPSKKGFRTRSQDRRTRLELSDEEFNRLLVQMESNS